MSETSRYWVTLTRGFAEPLPERDFVAAQSFFHHVGDVLEYNLGLTAVEVSLGSTQGFEVSGIVLADDESEATRAVYDLLREALGLALADHVVPDLPPAPHQPRMKAHELLGRPSETRAVLLATAA